MSLLPETMQYRRRALLVSMQYRRRASRGRGGRRSPFIVGRGPVPRQHPRNPTLAGDRPPRYGEKRYFTVGRGPKPYGNPGRFFYRRSVRDQASPNDGLFQGPGMARDRPSPYGNRAAASVGQDRLILTRSELGEPERRSRVKGGRFFTVARGLSPRR